jgi:FkbM family methyltransferase
LFSVLAAFKVKEKNKVIAVEPEPNNLKILRENVELNYLKNVIIVPKALYNKFRKKVSVMGENVEAYVSEDREGSVDTITLDIIAEEIDLDPEY